MVSTKQTQESINTFLNKVCTRRGHINISNNNNNDNNNNNIYKKKLKERRERERDKTIDKYLRHKGIQSKTQDGLIQRKCFQS